MLAVLSPPKGLLYLGPLFPTFNPSALQADRFQELKQLHQSENQLQERQEVNVAQEL